MDTEIIMGIPVDNISYESILTQVPLYLNSNKKMSIISVNPQIVLETHNYPEIAKFIKNSTHRIPDGIGIVLVSKLTGGRITKRVAGYDLMMHLLAYANKRHLRVFLYGAKPEVLNDAVKNIKNKFKNITIAGTIDGYTKMTEETIIEHINSSTPDFLFVALGFPKQEQWLARNIKRVNASIFQDVGGSFDVISGHVKRAPSFFIKWHLEWLYRSVTNPKRIGRIIQLPLFLVKSLWWARKKR